MKRVKQYSNKYNMIWIDEAVGRSSKTVSQMLLVCALYDYI